MSNQLTSRTQLLDSLVRLPERTGLPSTKKGRRPSLLMRNSPDALSLRTPWRREIFQAGPSSDRSISTAAPAVLRPNVTSLERIRYRTRRPRSTASVWASKSGGLMPVTASTSTCQRPTSFSSCFISAFAKLHNKNRKFTS